MSDEGSSGSFLSGQLLIAMPGMRDERFAKSVIYMCAHSEEGAMGLILNQPASDITFADLLDRLEIYQDSPDEEPETPFDSLAVRTGGPVETSRGFVLHSPDYFVTDTTLPIDENVCLTATVDILKAIASGKGPHQAAWLIGVLETIQKHVVVHGTVAEPQALAHFRQNVRRVGHALHAAGHDHVIGPHMERVIGHHHGLHARATHLVDGGAGR